MTVNLRFTFTLFPLLRVIELVPVIMDIAYTFLRYTGKIQHMIYVGLLIVVRCQNIDSAADLNPVFFPFVDKKVPNRFTYIRYILPQGSSFDDLTQDKVNLMMSHINSTARPSLQGKTPIELALQHFGKDTVEKLGLHVIEPDDVCLKAQLLK